MARGDAQCLNCGEASVERGGEYRPELGCPVCNTSVEDALQVHYRREIDRFCAECDENDRQLNEAGRILRAERRANAC